MNDDVPPEEARQIADDLRTWQNPDADPAARDAAAERVTQFLHHRLFGVAQWRAAQAGMSAGELFNGAFLSLLKQLPGANTGGEADGMPTTAERLRAAFCALLYYRAVDFVRSRARHPAVALENPSGLEASASASGPGLESADLDRLQNALVWLDRNHPRLATAFKARLLVNPDLRFSQAGQTFSRTVREQMADGGRTFREMSEMIGCSLKTAYERYSRAVELLRQRLPEFGRDGPWGGA